MLKVFLKKVFFAGLFFVLAVSITGCFAEEEEEKLAFTELVIGTPLNDSIPAYGTKVYRVNFTSTGDYYVALTGLGSDCGMTFCTYDASDTSLDSLVDNIIREVDFYYGTASETTTLVVGTTGYMYIVVDEWSNEASYYTLTVTGPTKGSVETVKLELEPVDLNIKSFPFDKDVFHKWSNK